MAKDNGNGTARWVRWALGILIVVLIALASAMAANRVNIAENATNIENIKKQLDRIEVALTELLRRGREKLGYVRPGFSADNVGNGPSCYGKLPGDATGRLPDRMALTYSGNIGGFEFRGPIIFSSLQSFRVRARAIAVTTSIATFLHRVGVVVRMSPQKQMADWIHTGWIVAMMKNTHAGRNRTIGNRPRDARGKKRVARTVCVRTKAERTVTFCLACHPRPTFIRLPNANFLPKSENVLFAQRRDATMRLSHDSLLCRDSWSERLAARSAGRSLSTYPTRAAA